MRKVAFALVVLIASVGSQAVTIADNFNNGISTPLWDVFDSSASGLPWTVDTLRNEGRLVISKSADNNNTWNPVAGLKSKFQLVGDFSAVVDFELINFPSGDFYSNTKAKGWNWAALKVTTTQATGIFEGTSFSTLRGSSDVKGGLGGAEGWVSMFGNTAYNIGLVRDETMTGKFGITRQGDTISAWLDRGNGLDLLGSFSSPNLDVPVYIHLIASQVPYSADRPHTALDVRYDNFTATADSIIPEPCTLSLLAIGGIALLRKRK